MSTHPPDGQPKFIFPKKESSWLARHGIWFIPLMIFVIGVPVLCAGSIFLFARAGLGLVLGPKNAAVDAMRGNPAVVSIMGEPIEGSNHIQIQDMHVKNKNGHVQLQFEAEGPDSTADVQGHMILDDGDWEVGHITISFPDGQIIELGDPVHRPKYVKENDQPEAEDATESGGFSVDLGGD